MLGTSGMAHGSSSVSIRDLPRGYSPEKQELYEEALKGAAIDQKEIIAEYNKKFDLVG